MCEPTASIQVPSGTSLTLVKSRSTVSKCTVPATASPAARPIAVALAARSPRPSSPVNERLPRRARLPSTDRAWMSCPTLPVAGAPPGARQVITANGIDPTGTGVARDASRRSVSARERSRCSSRFVGPRPPSSRSRSVARSRSPNARNRLARSTSTSAVMLSTQLPIPRARARASSVAVARAASTASTGIWVASVLVVEVPRQLPCPVELPSPVKQHHASQG